jgi:hypothetical protein
VNHQGRYPQVYLPNSSQAPKLPCSLPGGFGKTDYSLIFETLVPHHRYIPSIFFKSLFRCRLRLAGAAPNVDTPPHTDRRAHYPFYCKQAAYRAHNVQVEVGQDRFPLDRCIGWARDRMVTLLTGVWFSTFTGCQVAWRRSCCMLRERSTCAPSRIIKCESILDSVHYYMRCDACAEVIRRQYRSYRRPSNTQAEDTLGVTSY